jgi:hypothetical protein
MQETARFILIYLVFPLWVAAGFADWTCHRRTGIAFTSGLKENLLHVLMFVQIGLGIVAVVLLKINAAVLVFVFAVFVVHQLTVFGELRYSTMLRDVGPFEQMVHSFMEMLPLLSLALLAVMAWPQAMALAGMGPERADWALRLKDEPLSEGLVLAGLLMALLFNVLPLLQETWSCLLARSTTARRGRPAQRPTARTPPNPEPR